MSDKVDRCKVTSILIVNDNAIQGSRLKRHGLRKPIYIGLGGVAWTAGLVAVIAATLDKLGPTRVWSWLLPTANWLHDDGVWLAPIAGMMAGSAAVAKKNIGEPWIWEAIHRLIDDYRDFVFTDGPDDDRHYHRITLFKFFRWWEYPACFCAPLFCDKLMPVERSGHLTQKCKAVFCVPDDADKAEGVAGRAFARWNTLIVSGLPDPMTDPTPDDAIVRYASNTWSAPHYVRDRVVAKRPFARSLCGIPVRVKGKEWGVLVLDSRDPQAIERANQRHYEHIGRSLQKLLERA